MPQSRHTAPLPARQLATAALLVCAGWVVPAPAQDSAATTQSGYELLTAEQYAEIERSYTGFAAGERRFECSTRSSSAGGPRLTVESPDLSTAVVSPVDLRVRFEAGPDTEVQVDSLKVCVATALFPIEVTGTVLKNAKVTKQGIESEQTKLRPGDYDIVIELADSKRRLTRERFTVQVKRAGK